MESKEKKCPKCGFVNAYGTKRCFKCHKKLENDYVSCPKCAKKNSLTAKRCVSCGFNLKRKRLSLFACLCISVLIGGLLYLCIYYNKEHSESIMFNVRIVYSVLAVLIIIGVLRTTLTYGRKDQLKFDAEEEISNNNPRLKMLKLISSIAVVIGVLAIAIFIIYKYILK